MYGLVKLHEDTSQWSTQGFGNTLSALVDAGLETSRDVIGVFPPPLPRRNTSLRYMGYEVGADFRSCRRA